MRTIKLIYPNLVEKRSGLKLAIRDELQLKHLQVLRADAENYNYVIADGLGNKADAKLVQLTKEGALFELTSSVVHISSGPNLVLALPLIRLPLLEQALVQVTQLDMYSEIWLYFSDYTRYSKEALSPRKLERFEKLLKNSFTQSQSNILPVVALKQSLAEVLTQVDEGDIVFAPSLGAEVYSHTQFAARLKNLDEAGTVITIVGSEGGFSTAELEGLSQQNDAYLAQLGDSVLTTDTAAVVFSGLLKAALD